MEPVSSFWSRAWETVTRRKALTVALAVAGVIGFCLLVFAIKYNSARNGLVDRETTLNAQYLDNQNTLDAFLKTAHETFDLANIKTDKLDRVLTDAVKGRYEGDTTARPGSGQLFSAVFEAYPDLAALNVFDRVQTVVEAGRAEYKGVQSRLLDLLREYDSFRTRGVLHSWLVGVVGYPKLEARIGPDVKTGAAARERMYTLVLSSNTREAFKTGEQGPIDFDTGD